MFSYRNTDFFYRFSKFRYHWSCHILKTFTGFTDGLDIYDKGYRELHSYVYHYICSKIGGVKNTVCSIITNVCRCVMLNRST